MVKVMSFAPKKIVNEGAVSEFHVNKAAAFGNGRYSMYEDDSLDGVNCFCGNPNDDEASQPLQCFDKNLFVFCRVPPEQIAAQITLIDVKLFKAIKGHEFYDCAWSKKDKNITAPNIVAFTKRFNQVCFWVVKEVLNERNLRLRAEIITQFIKIAKRLLDLNNLHGLMAIISGLQSAPIHRLSATWKSVAKKDKVSLDKLVELMSQNENSKLVREHLNELQLPCIPYLGMYLTDLTFLNLSRKKNGSISTPTTPVGKCPRLTITSIQGQIDSILNTIGYFQNSTYDFPEQQHVMEYLTSYQYIDGLEKIMEDTNYKLSLEIEPIDDAAVKSRTLGHHSSFSSPFKPLTYLLRSKSDEDLLHTASPLLHKVTASHHSSIQVTDRTRMIEELSNRLSGIASIDNEDDNTAISDRESSPQEPNMDNLSPVIKITDSSPIAPRKQCRASSEDLTALRDTGTLHHHAMLNTTTTLTKSITPSVSKKKYVGKHRKARSLGSNVLASLGIQSSIKSKSADASPPIPPVQLPTVSLLDDSIISSPPFLPAPGSIASSSSSSLISLDTDEELAAVRSGDGDFVLSCELAEYATTVKEGLLKRRVLKKYGKLSLKRKEKVWVQLIGSALLMWPHKQWLKNKKKLKETPTKNGLSLDEFRVIYQDPTHSYKLADHQFIITNDKNTVIKFSAPGGTQEANDWVTRVRDVIWSVQRRAEEIKTNESLIKL
ncbi:ras-specific guanine nucleotide-releasing factor RalGPS2-like isoform X2 [Dysidea avara]